MTRRAAEEALAAGDLAGCRARLVEAVRAAPGDASLRAFLFQLSCVLGDWERADKALGVLGQLEPDSLDMVGDYRAAIAAEKTRAAVFAGTIPPDLFGDRRPWVDDLAEALRREAAGEPEAAADLRARALEAAPADPGVVNGERFAWFADADTRLGPVLEAVMNGAYRWIALSDIQKLEVPPPSDLRDLVWSVGVLTIAEGAQWPVMIPTRYPGSENPAEPALALARRTEWRELAQGHVAGLGQRMFAHPGGDVAMLDLRSLEIDRPEPAAWSPDDAESAPPPDEAQP